jgi:CheY-like chemotaxis protein
MEHIRLVHWNAEEAEERAEHLKAAGYEVDHEVSAGPSLLHELGEDPPAAVVIDLSRLPSQGRDLALLVRKRKATRHIPLVFVGGDAEKTDRIQGILPDAVYTSWAQIGGLLEDAIRHPPENPVVPHSVFAGYSGKPLGEKLGIKANSVVALAGAPERFREILGDLPEGAQVHEGARSRCDLIIWFTRSGAELKEEIEEMAARLERGSLWIAWPKKASKMATDLSQQHVREVGLAAGLVDYKICSIDETWSALLFTRRKKG